MTTFEERLDKILGMARELGEAEAELSEYERLRDASGPHTSDGARARRNIPTCRQRVQRCEARLSSARDRMIRSHQEVGPCP